MAQLKDLIVNGPSQLIGTATTGADPTTDLGIATKHYVDNAFSANDAMLFKGVVNSNNDLPTTHYQGWTYRVNTAGTYAGKVCEIGDLIICITDGTAANNDHWVVAQGNVETSLFKGTNTFTDNHFLVSDGTAGKVKDSGYILTDAGINPPSNNTKNLGDSSKYWANIYGKSMVSDKYSIGKTTYSVLEFYIPTSTAATEVLIKTGIIWTGSVLHKVHIRGHHYNDSIIDITLYWYSYGSTKFYGTPYYNNNGNYDFGAIKLCIYDYEAETQHIGIALLPKTGKNLSGITVMIDYTTLNNQLSNHLIWKEGWTQQTNTSTETSIIPTATAAYLKACTLQKLITNISGVADKTVAANLTTTQNAIAKYSDTVGTFANSGVTIDSSNNITTNGNVIATELKGYVTIGQRSGYQLGEFATAEGDGVIASGDISHAEGADTVASESCAHAEGSQTTASGNCSHAEGNSTTASGLNSHAEGYQTIVSGGYSHVEGRENTVTNANSHAEGRLNVVQGASAHAEGYKNVVTGNNAHAEGKNNLASGNSAHVEGYGDITYISTGNTVTITKITSPVQCYNITSGSVSVGQYIKNNSSSDYLLVTHIDTITIANNVYYDVFTSPSFNPDGGTFTVYNATQTGAIGDYSHAEGRATIANTKSQHVFGEYNIADTTGSQTTRGTYAEIVGNGTADNTRSNARTLDWDGNEKLAGDLLPMVNNSQDLGSMTKTWNTLYTKSIHIGSNNLITEQSTSETLSISGINNIELSPTNNLIFEIYNDKKSSFSFWNSTTSLYEEQAAITKNSLNLYNGNDVHFIAENDNYDGNGDPGGLKWLKTNGATLKGYLRLPNLKTSNGGQHYQHFYPAPTFCHTSADNIERHLGITNAFYGALESTTPATINSVSGYKINIRSNMNSNSLCYDHVLMPGDIVTIYFSSLNSASVSAVHLKTNGEIGNTLDPTESTYQTYKLYRRGMTNFSISSASSSIIPSGSSATFICVYQNSGYGLYLIAKD